MKRKIRVNKEEDTEDTGKIIEMEEVNNNNKDNTRNVFSNQSMITKNHSRWQTKTRFLLQTVIPSQKQDNSKERRLDN